VLGVGSEVHDVLSPLKRNNCRWVGHDDHTLARAGPGAFIGTPSSLPVLGGCMICARCRQPA